MWNVEISAWSTVVLLFGCAAALCAAPQPMPVDYDRILTPADVESTTGLQGISLVPRDPAKGAGGRLNFGLADGQLILMINFETVSPDRWLKTKNRASFKSVYGGPVQGLGDEAFDGPPGGEKYILSVLKGQEWFTLNTYLDRRNMKPILTMEQLKAIARLILGRM